MAAVSTDAVRAPRGPAALFARAGLLVVISALPALFSAWIDPARLVAPRSAEREIARVLASGRNVTDVANYDDRAIEHDLATLRPTAPEILVLGSSRMQPLRASAFGGAPFVNGAVQGAVLDDMLAVYAMHDSAGRRPHRVVIGVDPWTESMPGDGWRFVAADHDRMLRRLGVPHSPVRERVAMWTGALETVASPEYFRLALYSFRRYGARGLAWRVSDAEQNAEKTKLPDGSVVWPVVPPERAESAAHAFATTGIVSDARFHQLDRRAPGRAGALETFVRYLGDEGVNVTLVLVPFPPEVYDAMRREPGYSVTAVERDVRALAARTGALVRGSYDPRAVATPTREFFDEDHLRPDALARLVAR